MVWIKSISLIETVNFEPGKERAKCEQKQRA
jgi:hypothetical protein